jgi:hypothetical protein
MDATEALRAASAATADLVAAIDAKVRDRLVKRARKHGLSQDEAIKHVAAWKTAARKTKHLHLGRHKGH